MHLTVCSESQKAEPSFHWYVGDANASLAIPTLENALEGKIIIVTKIFRKNISGSHHQDECPPSGPYFVAGTFSLIARTNE